jgi:hypothetical protein
MMTKLSLVLYGLLFSYLTFAQNTEPIVVKTGTSISEGVPVAELYQYTKFVNGMVYFRNGTSSGAPLNYNRFLDEMQFITTNGDTLTLDNEETIKLVIANNDSFYFDKGYFMVISSNHSLKLALKQGFKILNKQKTAAYDMSSSVSSIRNVNSYDTESRLYKVGVAEDVVLTRESYYYFGNKYNQFVLSNKKNLLELYPKHRYEIRKYLKQTNVEFQNKADLEKLLQYLVSL